MPWHGTSCGVYINSDTIKLGEKFIGTLSFDYVDEKDPKYMKDIGYRKIDNENWEAKDSSIKTNLSIRLIEDEKYKLRPLSREDFHVDCVRFDYEFIPKKTGLHTFEGYVERYDTIYVYNNKKQHKKYKFSYKYIVVD